VYSNNGNYLKDTEGFIKVIGDAIIFTAFSSFREMPLAINFSSGLRIGYQALF
jgi:hypothetical protein